jgi:hypothetical protein
MRRHLLSAAVFFATTYSTLALIGIAPVLTNAVRSGDQFQFTIRGETNVSYIIQSSSDLRAWTAAVTNSDLQATRTVIVPATTAQGFWRVRPMPSPLFEYAIVAQGSIQLGGSGRIDSFDSSDPLESGPGGSYDPSLATDRAVLATTSRAAGVISVGNMSIYGSVGTGPGGTVTLAPSGAVGDMAYNSSSTGIQPGHWFDDFRVILPPAKLPSGFASFPMPVLQNVTYPAVGGTNYRYAIVVDGDYRITSISLSTSQKMLVKGKARLYVQGSTTVSGANAHIIIAPDSSIEWYAGGVVSMGGGGCVNNSGLPENFSIFELSNAPVTYSGTVPFIGTIYAPMASVTLTGTSDAVGSVVGNTVTVSGSMGLHFDENLERVGPFF